MKKNTIALCTALLCTFLVFAPRAALADDNNLRDASFELKLSPDQGGWILFDQSMLSPNEARSGGQSMFNWGFSRTVPSPPYLLGTVSGSYQEFPASPDSQWRLTGFGITPTTLKGAPANGFLQISFRVKTGLHVSIAVH